MQLWIRRLEVRALPRQRNRCSQLPRPDSGPQHGAGRSSRTTVGGTPRSVSPVSRWSSAPSCHLATSSVTMWPPMTRYLGGSSVPSTVAMSATRHSRGRPLLTSSRGEPAEGVQQPLAQRPTSARISSWRGAGQACWPEDRQAADRAVEGQGARSSRSASQPVRPDDLADAGRDAKDQEDGDRSPEPVGEAVGCAEDATHQEREPEGRSEEVPASPLPLFLHGDPPFRVVHNPSPLRTSRPGGEAQRRLTRALPAIGHRRGVCA